MGEVMTAPLEFEFNHSGRTYRVVWRQYSTLAQPPARDPRWIVTHEGRLIGSLPPDVGMTEARDVLERAAIAVIEQGRK